MNIVTRVLLALVVCCFVSCNQNLSGDEIFEKYYQSPVSKEKGFYSANPDNGSEDKLYYEAHEKIKENVRYSAKLFERLSLSDADKHKEDADWFYALSKIKLGQMEEATKRLKVIQGIKYHKYEKEAYKLDKMIN